MTSLAEKHWNLWVFFLTNSPRQQIKSVNWLHIGTKGVNNFEMSSVSTISHEERLLPQHFSVNDVILKRIYLYIFFRVKYLPEGGFCILLNSNEKIKIENNIYIIKIWFVLFPN